MMRAMSLCYRYPGQAAPASLAQPKVQALRRRIVGSLCRAGDAKSASRAARTLREFVESQRAQASERPAKPSRGVGRGVDDRLWLDDSHWLAWTISGELVSVAELAPGGMRGSPEVRKLRADELPVVFGANRLIRSVIALYHGDSLERGPVWRYITHHDLGGALATALARAQSQEERLLRAREPVASASVRPKRSRATKTRHHPLGNFILYRRPRDGDKLPPFAAFLELPPVPEAFPTRRAAQRFLAKMPRLGFDADGLVIARVIGSVEVRPRWRLGIAGPREPEDAVELIRREPRVVLPELDAAWLPRYVQGKDGRWVRKQVQNRGTVRGRSRRFLLDEITAEGRRCAAALEDHVVRQSAGAQVEDLSDQLGASWRIANKAERLLPKPWLEQLGMERESLGPDWRLVADAGLVADEGHWLRAPCEYGRPHVDGQRRRIVELRINDIAGLLECAGMRPLFLLVKPHMSEPPEWRLAVRPLPT